MALWLEKNGTDASEPAFLGNADGLSQVERVINAGLASAFNQMVVVNSGHHN